MANIFRSALLIASLGGCASLTVREHFTRYGLPRAALELDCPREKIEIVQVDQSLDQPLYSGGTLVGVKGCSRRGVYVSLDNGTWLLNSVSTGNQGGSPAPANAKKSRSKK